MTETALPFVGHKSALREVTEALGSGRMPHAWLIAGVEGIGKAAFAKHISQLVLCQKDKDSAAKLVASEAHPDLLFVRREIDEKTGTLKNTIPVEKILTVAPFLHKTAAHNGWRVVIVDEAHTLNRFGQNAILKIVEEPPPRALILLTVTTPGILLPTIRSRARTLQLLPLSYDEMRAVLAANASKHPPDDIDTAVQLSGGSVGFAFKILRTETLPLYRELLSILDALPEMDVARMHKLADQIARKSDAESFEALSALFIERLRKAAHDEASERPSARADMALKIWDKTRAAFATAEAANLDKKLTFINAICDIRALM